MKFYSRIINREITRVLGETTGVIDVVGDQIHRGVAYPAGVDLPALLFRGESADYFGAVQSALPAEHITGGTYRYTIQLDDTGESDTDIASAAEAQLSAFAGLSIDTDDGYQLTFQAIGEIPITTNPQGATMFQRLGTIYIVTVTEG